MMARKLLATAGIILALAGSLSLVEVSAQSRMPQGQVSYQTTALQTPAQILERLRVSNNIPAEIAPKLRVEQSSVLNAATNGQDIVITSGLLKQLKTNDECAFILSHELSHIILNHIGKTQFRRTGLSLLDTLFLRRYVSQGSLLELAANLGLQLYDKRSGRVLEYEADDIGIQLMSKAGYNPQAAIEVFKILQAATPQGVPEFLQDHPITESRIRVLVQKYKLSNGP